MSRLGAVQRQWLERLGAIVGASPASDDGGARGGEPSPIAALMGAPAALSADARGGPSPPPPVKAGAAPQVAPKAAPKEDLPKKAKVVRLGMTRVQYDFGRPITLEQAAKVLFVDGQVPREAQLLPGPGANSWTLQAADLDDWQATLRRMRARTQTVMQRRPNTDNTTWNPPEPDEITEEWSDEPRPARKGPQRRDLDNDLGFKIAKHYRLDEGKSPVKHVKSPLGLGKGHGYELVFAKPATRAEVMDTLFGNNDLGEGTVYLKPSGREPATTWQVHVIGVDALGAFKRPVFRAIADANTEAPESIAPDVPKGIRSHIENKTVPKYAKHHPPDVYVWEQERHLVRVETDGKGGYYDYEVTALTDSDEASNITIRYFMVEQGLKSRQAWQEYIKHWDWIHQQILTGLALALASGRLPGKAPPMPTRVPVRRVPTRPGLGAPEPRPGVSTGPSRAPAADIGRAPTEPAPVPRPVPGRPLDDTQPMPVPRTTQPGVGIPRRTPATPAAPPAPAPRTTQPGVGPPGPGPAKPATPPAPARQGTLPGVGPPGPPPRKPVTQPPGAAPRDRADPRSVNLPDSQPITVTTSRGREQMTVGDYRQRAAQAKDWVDAQRKAHPPDSPKVFDYAKHYDEAASRFGLEKNWQRATNPYTSAL